MSYNTASINERILATSDQNNRLLRTLYETEYAPSDLAQSKSYLNDLQHELSVRSQAAMHLKFKLDKEQKEHEAYRDSTMKRLAYRMSGKKEKFTSKAEKEEREYLEAVQSHFAATQQVDHLKRNIEEAKRRIDELTGVAGVHDTAQKELDALYDSIFAGPTPEYPEEDQAEGPVGLARQQYGEIQTRLSTETQVVSILADADTFMKRALGDLAEARDASGMDMWGVGGSFADMAERSALGKAQSHTSQVEMLVSQARRVQPAVKDIGRMKIAGGHVMSDIIFDNIFSDMAMHDEIKASQANVQQVANRLKEEIELARRRQAGVKQESDAAGARLEAARKELENVRARTYERVAGGLPAYTA